MTDRPWGTTLGALGIGQRCAELVLRERDREFRMVFDRGLIVSAQSPLAADSVVRVALTNHTIAPSQTNEIKRRIAAAPALDEIDVLASTINLTPEQTRALRVRVITQRAARTFAVEQGEYTLEEFEPLPIAAAGADVRAVIYAGARGFLSDERMARDLRRFGARYILREDVIPILARFGFGDPERPVLAALRAGTSLPELEALNRELDPRSAQSIIYALASCDGLVTDPFANVDTSSLPRRAGSHAGGSQSGPLPRPGSQSGAFAASGSAPKRTLTPVATPMTAHRSMTPVATPIIPGRTPTPESTRTRMPAQYDDDTEPTGVPIAGMDPHSSETRAVPMEMMVDPTTTETVRVAVSKEMLERIAAGGAKRRPPYNDPGAVRSDDPSSGSPSGAAGGAKRRPPYNDPGAVRSDDPSSGSPSGAAGGPKREMMESFRTGATTTVRPNALTRKETEQLIAERYTLVDAGADHFTLLGVEVGAPVEDVHAAYVELARHLKPARLIELGIIDDTYKAHAVLAQIGIAFTVLTDRLRRPEYIASLQQKLRTRTASHR